MADLRTRGVGSQNADVEAYQHVNAVLRGRATHSQRRFEINGRSLEQMSIQELQRLAAYFAQQIRWANTGTAIRTVGEGSQPSVPEIARLSFDPYAYNQDYDLSLGTVSGVDTAIAATGDGLDVELLPLTTAPGGILADTDFVTDYEGFLHVRAIGGAFLVDTSLRFYHQFGSMPGFWSSRDYGLYVLSSLTGDIPMVVYSSRVNIETGTYSTQDGTTITVTDADLEADVDIRIILRIKLFSTGSPDTRQAGSINITGDNLAVHFTQLNTEI